MDAHSNPPKFSIIIPTFNRPDRLTACLEAISEIDHPSFETIIVDDGSDQPIASIIEVFAERMLVRAYRQTNGGPASARNRGAKEAHGEFLAFTDDDCRPDARWLRAFEEQFEIAPDALLGGDTSNGIDDSICSAASQDIVSFLYARAQNSAFGFEFFTSNNMACRRSLFLEIGGFDQSFPLAAGEDREFGIRWGRRGHDLVFVRDATLTHFHRQTLRQFWRQQSNYGRGAHQLRHLFVARKEPTVPFAGLRFYSDLLLFPFYAKRAQPALRSGLMAISQLAMVQGFLLNMLKRA